MVRHGRLPYRGSVLFSLPPLSPESETATLYMVDGGALRQPLPLGFL